MKSQFQGSVVGAGLLITGSCVGAGMLGLPILTGFAGFFPSMLMFILAWALMTGTALLLVEVGAWFTYTSNFSTMMGTLLGRFYKSLCLVLYLSLFYSLLVAYIADSGIHSTSFLSSFGVKGIKEWMGSLFFVLFFGWMIYLGTKAVDLLNRVLMFVKIISFLTLIITSFHLIESKHLFYTNPKYMLFPLPILVISFGFHNMIPTLFHYLHGDVKRVKQSIILGSLITLGIYLIWLIITLGALPLTGENSILSSYRLGFDAAKTLQVLFPHIALAASLLSFAAILTSFLAQSISVAHFLSDGFKLKYRNNAPLGIVLLTFLPPLFIAWTNPTIFYKALSFGGVIAVLLFGIFPVVMIYKGRYIEKRTSPYQLFGGKFTLGFLFLFSFFILLTNVLHHLGVECFPIPN